MNPLLKDIFSLAKQIVTLSNDKGLSIGTAESCTGGLIGGAITAIPGSSNCFKGGITAYDNAVKEGLLGVPKETLINHGAVSRQAAEAMASGALKTLGLDIAISVTGIAGPGGGSAEKPVGTVWIGFAAAGNATATLYEFGDIGRNRVRDQACFEGLKMLQSNLSKT